MDQELWRLRQQSRVLQEFRQEIGSHWSDEAARDLNHRYLDPHQADDASTVKGIILLNDALKHAEAHLAAAGELAGLVNQLSRALGDEIELSQEDSRMSFQLLEQYAEYRSRALARFPVVDELIRRAYAICEGVPTQ